MRQRGKLDIAPVMPEEQYQAEMKRALDSYIHAGVTDHPEYAKAKAQLEQHDSHLGSEQQKGTKDEGNQSSS